jgi:hypothetical protein
VRKKGDQGRGSKHRKQSIGEIPGVVAAAGEHATREFEKFFAEVPVSVGTRQLYRGHVRRFFRWVESKGITLADISQADLRDFLEGLPRSVSLQALPAFRGLFNHLVSVGVLKENPAPPGRLPRKPTLKELKRALRDPYLGFKDEPELFEAALVLVAGTFYGNQDLEHLSRFTGVSLETVQQYAANLRRAGVWTDDGCINCCWLDSGTGNLEKDVEFVLHAMVAAGKIEKVGEDYSSGRHEHI